MVLITPDLSDMTKPLEAGEYKVRITGAEAGEWRTGTPYVNWKMEIFDHDQANGRMVFHKTPTAGKGIDFLARFYKAAMKQDIGGAFDADELMSKEVKVVLQYGVDQEGNTRSFPDVKSVAAL